MFTFKSRLLKFGYGYDVSGEVMEGGGTSGQDKEIESQTSEPWLKHETSKNPVNLAVDSEAEREFPEIMNKPNRYPARAK